MKFRSLLESPSGVRRVYEQLELSSAYSRQLLLESVMMTRSEEIEGSFVDLEVFRGYFGVGESYRLQAEQTTLHLSHLKDVRTTLERVKEGGAVDDIELFEVKNLAMVSERVRGLVGVAEEVEAAQLPNLGAVIELLDPEGHGLGSFYVYDSYCTKLAEMRAAIKGDRERCAESLAEIEQREAEIRAELVVQLKPHCDALGCALHRLGRLDIMLAKVGLMDIYGYRIPQISLSNNRIEGLFHPTVAEVLRDEGKEFQKIDIEFGGEAPLLVTGANMGGKSVTLRSLALIQQLFQFGFPVPVREAQLTPVEAIYLSMDSRQSIEKGLSSFAAEMKRLNEILGAVKSGQKLLVLIDEPGSTTNPLEGTALVEALLKIVKRYDSLVVVTTHYNVEGEGCRRLRVRGFVEGEMDYSLVEDSGAKAPQEALRVATALGVDPEWVELAKEEIEKIE